MADEKWKRHVLFWSAAAAGAALDLASKYAVFAWLGWPGQEGAGPRRVLGSFFSLRAALNKGTFFGLGSDGGGSNTALIIFTVLMSAIVLYMYLLPPKEARGRGLLYTLALGLVFAGALGNLYDRVRYDAVRDFLDFGLGASRWPTFNLADAWLTVGIAMYLLALLRMRGRRPDGKPAEESAGGQ